MKISVGMVEAGIFALDKINRTKMSNEAVVSAVFSAMDAVRAREDVKSPTRPAAYVHQSWPAFRYGPGGQSAKFLKIEDVPEGWVDSPTKAAALTFVEAAKAVGAETIADLAEKRKPGRPKKLADAA